MKQTLILATLLFFSTLQTPLLAQQDHFIEDSIERLENSRKYLLLVAELMPEEKYNYKVTERSTRIPNRHGV